MTKIDYPSDFVESKDEAFSDSPPLETDTGDEINVENSSNKKAYSEEDLEEEIPMSFPQRLMDILSDEEHSDVISWLPHGKGFIIYKKKKFAVQVMPKYFKQSKFTSFTRKLNRWGFVRVTRGPETGAYYHKLFQRGNLRLCMQMSCQSSKTGMMPPIPAICGSFGGTSSGFGNSLTLSNDNPTEIAQLNQNMIRQQLQQLQLQQIELQQLQIQQQQQLQAAELLRQALAKQNGDVCTDQTSPNTTFFQSLQMNKEPDSLVGTQPLALYPTLQNGISQNGTFGSMGDSFLSGNGNGRGGWAA